MSYPYRNPLVQIDLPQPEPDSRLLLNHATGRYLRLGLREFDWLTRLDGKVPRTEIAALLGQDESLVQELLRRFEAAKLICFSDEPVALVETPQAPTENRFQARRFEWERFGQLRIHVGKPEALLGRLAPLGRALFGKSGIVISLLVCLIGFAVALAQGAELLRIFQNFNWAVGSSAGLLALIFVMTAIHEFGHAVACHYYGAPVRSLGVMVYYLQPAAYADVTDSWQLKNRWQRVGIALAGIYVQGLVTTLAVVVWSLLKWSGRSADMLAMFIVLNATIILFNVIPFVRLDGYWVVSNMLGIPNLRDRSLEWARTLARAGLRRRAIEPQSLRYNAVLTMPVLDRTLLAAFGYTAMVFGLGMWIGGLGFLFRLMRWLGLTGGASFAGVGAVMVFFVLAYVGSRLLARRRARRPNPNAAAAAPPTRPLAAVVTHAIDPNRPLRLNPHVAAVGENEDTVTFAWSTPDALTVQVPAAFFDLIPRLREGQTTLSDLQKTEAWGPQTVRALQSLWHERHLRYAADWELSEADARYSRQLGWFSMNSQVRGKEAEAQARLRNSSVTILGVGGLGTHVAWNLAACGIGELHLVDGDVVELTNLNRQLFYTPADVGRRKVEVAAERLRDFDPHLRLRTTHQYLESVDDIRAVIAGSDFVIRAVDSPTESIAWVNEACVRLGIPYSGAGFFPQGTIVGPTVVPGESPCLACNAPPTPPRFDRGTGGTLAPFVTVTASLLAGETVTYLAKLGTVQTLGKMLAINAPAISFSFREVPLNRNCPVCSLPEKERVSA